MLTVKIKGEKCEMPVGTPGRHQGLNMLAALAAADAVGAPLEPAINALAELKPAEGRGARKSNRGDGRRGGPD